MGKCLGWAPFLLTPQPTCGQLTWRKLRGSSFWNMGVFWILSGCFFSYGCVQKYVGFSIIFTIHFGVPVLLETSLSWLHSWSLTVRPWKVTETQKETKRKGSSSNHHFGGAMLNFGGVIRSGNKQWSTVDGSRNPIPNHLVCLKPS